MAVEQSGPTVCLDDLQFIGHGLERPECVLATASGKLFSADWRGGVAVIDADGDQSLIKAGGDVPTGGLKPNGIALCPDGSFLIAHLDDAEGGVWHLAPDGVCQPWLMEIDGDPLPPTNFVHLDDKGRTWVTVSTRIVPRTLARTPEVADGFVVLVTDGGARIVADGIGFTNEAKVDPSGRWLYVNETFGRRVSRFAIADDGALSQCEVYAEFDAGVYPDGLDFDVEGGLWITSILSNRLIRIAPDCSRQVVLEDYDAPYLDKVERDYRSGALVHRPAETVPSRVLRNVSSIAFGGSDRRTAFLGCLQGDSIATFRSPVAGVAPTHWNFG